MKFQKYAGIAGVVVAGAMALTACGTNNNATPPAGSKNGTIAGVKCAKGTLNSSGSTAQANAISEWTKNYQSACPGSTINYGGGGSGQGVAQFIQGSTDFAGSDSALKPEEHPQADKRCKAGKAVDLPMVVGPIGVVYNLQGVDGLQLQPETIAKIFAGKITKWNDPEIAKENPGKKLPSTTIQTVHRAEASGTTDNFTNFLHTTAPDVWKWDHDKQWKGPGGTGAKGSDGVAAQIKQQQGAIGYDEYSYVLNDKLQAAKVANGAGKYVELTATSASAGVGSAKVVGTGQDLSLQINYKPNQANAYPIVLTTYEIVCMKGLPSAKTQLLKSFLSYVSSDAGQQPLTKLGYAPLPKSIQSKVQETIKGIA